MSEETCRRCGRDLPHMPDDGNYCCCQKRATQPAEAVRAAPEAVSGGVLQSGHYLLRQLEDMLWMNDYCGLEASKHDAPAITEAIEKFRSALLAATTEAATTPNAPKAAAPAVAEAAEQAKRWISQVVIAAHRRSPAQTKIAVEALEAFIDLLAAAPQQVAEPAASERVALLEAALSEVLEFQSAHEGPHIFDWGRWRRIRDNTPPFQRVGSGPSQASAREEV